MGDTQSQLAEKEPSTGLIPPQIETRLPSARRLCPLEAMGVISSPPEGPTRAPAQTLEGLSFQAPLSKVSPPSTISTPARPLATRIVASLGPPPLSLMEALGGRARKPSFAAPFVGSGPSPYIKSLMKGASPADQRAPKRNGKIEVIRPIIFVMADRLSPSSPS